MEILYLSDVSQLDYVCKTNPLLLRHQMPMTADMLVAFNLEKLGVKFIDEWDYIKPEELKKNWDLAHRLSMSWWREKEAIPADMGYSLCEAAQQDMVYPFNACLNARTIYKRIFSEFSVEKINGYFLPNTPVIRTGPAPTSRAVSSLTQAVLFYLAEDYQIPIIKIPSNFSLTKAKLSVSNNKFKALINLLSSKIPTSRSNFKENQNYKQVVLIYEALMPAKEYAALINAMNKLSNVLTITISMHILQQGEFMHELRSNFDKDLKQSFKKIDKILSSYDGEFPEIFANKHLTFQFARNKQEIATATRCGSVFDAFLEILNPSLVIFAHEAFTVERVLVRMAKNRNILTASLSHTGVRHLLGYRGSVGEADVITVWNEVDISFLTSFGIEKSRIYKIGSIRYEETYEKYKNIHYLELSKEKIKAKKRIGLKIEKPLITLLTAAVNTGFAAGLADPKKHRDAIREFISLVKSRQDLQFVIKAHPSFDYYELYRRLIDFEKCPNIEFIENITIENILEASDLCLMINYCTTAALEAMLHKIPVVYVNNAVYPLEDWRDNLNDVGIHRIQSISELNDILDSILKKVESGNYAYENIQKQVIDLLDINNSTDTSRISSVIEQLLVIKKNISKISFLQAKKMEKFLFKNNSKTAEYHQSTNSSGYKQGLILAYSYLAGYKNFGPYSIDTVSEMLNSVTRNGDLKKYEFERQRLIACYLSGRLLNWDAACACFRDLRLILPYIIWPLRLLKLSSQERLNLAKFSILTTRELLLRKAFF